MPIKSVSGQQNSSDFVHPDAEFLSQFGASEAITMSRWINEVGPEAFAEMVFAFTQAAEQGRPTADYSRFIAEFHRIKILEPMLGDYAVAGRVAREAFSSAKNDENFWGNFNPPADVKSMQSTIVRQVATARPENKSAKADSARDGVVMARAQRRVAALKAVADRFILLGERIDSLKQAFDRSKTPGGLAADLEFLRALQSRPLPLASAIVVSLLGATRERD